MAITNTKEQIKSNHLLGILPGSIEAMESRGQQEFIRSQQLPINGNNRSVSVEEEYKKLGIHIIKKSEGDEYLFYDVKLPEGWKFKSTDHSMWNYLCDEKGRKRASIFYKAAFYDRSAHINFEGRFCIEEDYDGGSDHNNKKYKFVVRDGNEILFDTGLCYFNEEKENVDIWGFREKIRKQCSDWLKEKYPDYENPFAYWD